MWRLVLAFSVSVLGLSACATIPQALVGDFPALAPQAALGQAEGTRVRWGGEIIRTEPGPKETCFFVLSHPLDRQARPAVDHASTGRFVACKNGFYDPEEYLKGRELTVVGQLQETAETKVGEYEYTYPRVRADVVYLWPQQPQYVYVNGPWWGPWGVWQPWYGPYAFPPTIVVPPRAQPCK